MVLRQIFLRVVLWSPASIIPLMHHILDLFLVSRRLICCFRCVHFITYDLVYFVNWNIITMKGRSGVMTFLFDWVSLLFVGFVLLFLLWLFCIVMMIYLVIWVSFDLLCWFWYLLCLWCFWLLALVSVVSILLGWDGWGLVLAQGQKGEPRTPSKKQCSFGNRGALDRKVPSLSP